MTPEQLQMLRRVFYDAVDLPPAERAAVVSQANLEEELRGEVE
jgi:hypothetical protein